MILFKRYLDLSFRGEFAYKWLWNVDYCLINSSDQWFKKRHGFEGKKRGSIQANVTPK